MVICYVLLSSDVAVTGIRSKEVKAHKIQSQLQIAILTIQAGHKQKNSDLGQYAQYNQPSV